jgi:MFS family permease
MSSAEGGRFGDLRGPASRVVFGAMAAQMTMGAIYARGPLTPVMVEELGWARGDLMLAFSPQTWVTALASPVAGYLTARYGARPVVMFGTLWVAVVFVGLSQVQTIWQMFAVSVGIGILVASVGDVAVGAVVSRWVERGRGLALGIVYSGSNLGGVIGSVAAGALLLTLGWREACVWIGLGTSVLLFPLVALNVREPPSDVSSRETSSESADREGDRWVGLTLREAVNTREFWLLSFVLFLFYVYFIGVNANLTLYLTDIGMSPVDVALNYGLMVGVGVFAKVAIGFVADRSDAKRSLLVCFAFLIVSAALLLSLSVAPRLALVFVCVHGLATMAQNVVYPTIVAWCFGTQHMAEIYGMMMLALLPGGVIGPVALGYMYDELGSYELAFQLLFGATVASFLLLTALRRRSLPVEGGGAPSEREG